MFDLVEFNLCFIAFLSAMFTVFMLGPCFFLLLFKPLHSLIRFLESLIKGVNLFSEDLEAVRRSRKQELDLLTQINN